MLEFSTPVKFLGTETKKGTSTRTGKDYEVTEAKLFVPDLGRLRINVVGTPKLPSVDTMIKLSLSVDQGSFQSIRVIWDESSTFKQV